MHTKYTPNTQLTLLDPQHSHSLYGGDFGLIRGVYKPHGLATTRGKHNSLLDQLIKQYSHIPIIQYAIQQFGEDEELGMLTRLDNDTAGMVWFAHDHEVKSQWLSDQNNNLISKIYEADVIGWIHDPVQISVGIQHHRRDDSKMIISQPSNSHQGRGNIHQVSTSIIPQYIDGHNTHIQAMIHHGCRHQIRIHCAYHGNAILGETIYHKQKTSNTLHLWSVGVEWQALTQPIIVDYLQYT